MEEEPLVHGVPGASDCYEKQRGDCPDGGGEKLGGPVSSRQLMLWEVPGQKPAGGVSEEKELHSHPARGHLHTSAHLSSWARGWEFKSCFLLFVIPKAPRASSVLLWRGRLATVPGVGMLQETVKTTCCLGLLLFLWLVLGVWDPQAGSPCWGSLMVRSRPITPSIAWLILQMLPPVQCTKGSHRDRLQRKSEPLCTCSRLLTQPWWTLR